MGMETDERHENIYEQDLKQNGKSSSSYLNNDSNIVMAASTSSSAINASRTTGGNNDDNDYKTNHHYSSSLHHVHFSDDFEKCIEESMNDLEYIDSKNDIVLMDDQLIEWKEKYVKIKENRERTTSSSTDTSYGDDCDNEQITTISPVNNMSSNPFRSPEAIQQKMLFWRPLLIPYQERRRLSECKEEDETIIEETADNRYQITQSPSIAIKQQEQEQQQNQHKLQQINQTSSPLTTAQITTGTKHKFIVTKTKDDMTSLPRPEAEHLRHMTAKQNAATIHFPCSNNHHSSSIHRPTINSLFFASDRQQFNPHLDKQYFDTSLIEIRAINSTNTLNNQSSNDDNSVVVIDDMVWLPRTKIDNDSNENKFVSCIYYFFYYRIIY